MAILGLTGHVAHQLVHQHRDAQRLLLARGDVDGDLRIRQHAPAEHGGDTVDADPAGLDPGIGLAPRRHATLGHHF